MIFKKLEIIAAKNGMNTARICWDNGMVNYLHSSINPEKEAKDWVEVVDKKTNAVYAILGFGLGYHVKELMKVLPARSHIFIIEPDVGHSLYLGSRKVQKMTWWRKNRITVLTSDNIRDISTELAAYMYANVIDTIVICKHYPSMMVEWDFYIQAEKDIMIKAGHVFSINKNFHQNASEVMLRNSWKNLPNILGSPGIKNLAGKFLNVPAIVVAAGPSLNSSIQFIKENKGKFIVIAAGSAVSGLYKHGIIPNFIVVVDPFDFNAIEIVNYLHEDAVLVSPYYFANEVISRCDKNLAFAFVNRDSRAYRLLGDNLFELIPETTELTGNVSVSTLAIDFAVRLGCQPIALAGLNLAFTKEYETQYKFRNEEYQKVIGELQQNSVEEKRKKAQEILGAQFQHADGVVAGSYELDESNIAWVEGWNGEKLPTTIPFLDCIDFISLSVQHVWGEGKLINISVGGALISKVKNMHPSDFFAEYREHPNVDYRSEIKKTLALPVTVSKEKTIKWLKSVEKWLAVQKKDWQKYHDDVSECVKNNNVNEIELKRLDKLFEKNMKEMTNAKQYDVMKNSIEIIVRLTDFELLKFVGREHKLQINILKCNEFLKIIDIILDGVGNCLLLGK